MIREAENTEGNWWKDFFTILVFIALIGIIFTSIFYGIFVPSEDSDKSEGIFSRILNIFSSNDEKTEKNPSSTESEPEDSSQSNENIIKVKEEELNMYWSEPIQKILQLEQKIENTAAIVTKTFPAQIQQTTQFPKNQKIIQKTIVSTDMPDILSFDEPDESNELENFEPTWADVGKLLIKLEEEQGKSITELSKSE